MGCLFVWGFVLFSWRIFALLVKCPRCAAVQEPWLPWPRQVGAGKGLAGAVLPHFGDVSQGWGGQLVRLWQRQNHLS